MKRILIIVIASITAWIASGGSALSGAEKDRTQTGKVVVYYFQNSTKAGEYGYYTYIIADTIASEIRKTGKYEARSIPVTLEYIDTDKSRELFVKRMQFLTDRGKEFDADFVIHGTYYIENQIIVIKTQIFDVNEQKIKDIKETSKELGALLLIVIDKLSDKINSELQKSAYKTRPKREAAAKSPFIPVYKALSGFSFGFIHEMGTIHGPWGDIYDRTDITGFSIFRSLSDAGFLRRYPVMKNTFLLLKYDFFSSNNTESTQMTNLQVSEFSLNAGYSYPLSGLFSLDISAGPGICFSKIKVEMDTGTGPPETLKTERSIDPLLHLSAGVSITIERFKLSSSVSYRRIFFSDQALGASSLYFGIGYMI